MPNEEKCAYSITCNPGWSLIELSCKYFRQLRNHTSPYGAGAACATPRCRGQCTKNAPAIAFYLELSVIGAGLSASNFNRWRKQLSPRPADAGHRTGGPSPVRVLQSWPRPAEDTALGHDRFLAALPPGTGLHWPQDDADNREALSSHKQLPRNW